MRFEKNGPSIPNELVELRNNGEVVFFCGAGVSKPAGLPGFYELTKKLMNDLGVPMDAQAMRMMMPALEADDPSLAPPLDQVFSFLQKDYTDQHIQDAVTKLLRAPPRTPTKFHEIVLRLSRNAADMPFVATTNFDLLFERAGKGTPYWSYPSLPNLSADGSHSGIVYLHGRLGGGTSSKSNLLLSSRDLGRAYLADGWATTFVRQLMERKIIVFLGYSASDPPIRYLLEGLSDSSSLRPKAIFAFDRGSDDEVKARWSPLGVQGLAFEDFGSLWSTLEAWSKQAQDKEAWGRHLVSLSQKSPEDLEAFERGQVASLVATVSGAKQFANAEPAPPADWLCVFDRYRRFAKPEKLTWDEEAQTFSPQDAFGLDDDPKPDGDLGRTAIDLLETLATELDGLGHGRLSETTDGRRAPSARLAFLAHWFERVSHQPAAIWWSAKQRNLHSSMKWGVSRRLSGHGQDYDPQTRAVWTNLLEAEPADDLVDLGWYDFTAKLQRDGWSPSTLRHFERQMRPRLALDSFSPRTPRPPPAGPLTEELLSFEVVVPDRYNPMPEIPDADLHKVFPVLRKALTQAAELFSETVYRRSAFFRLPAIVPDDRPGDRYVRESDIAGTFLWAVEVFRRYASYDPEGARSEALKWPDPEPYFFDKFRIFAWSLEDLFPAEEIASGVLRLEPQSFCNVYYQRELLHLFRALNTRLNTTTRRQIEMRLRQGRPRYPKEDRADYSASNLHLIGTRLGWLKRNGWPLDAASRKKLTEARASSEWRELWEASADSDHDGRVGWVARETEPGRLVTSSLGSIVKDALAGSTREFDSFVERAPFAGLVSTQPARALAALAHEGRHGNFPVPLWRDLLSAWPNGVQNRLLLLCASRLVRLPTADFLLLKHEVTSWLEKHLPTLFSEYPKSSIDIWDRAYAHLVAGGDSATQSGIGESRVGGVVVRGARNTLLHAMNSPVGHLVDTLLALLPKKKNWTKGEGFPPSITSRLIAMLSAPGEGADHAATLLGQRLSWLYHCDPSLGGELLRAAQTGHPRFLAIWNGILAARQLPRPAPVFALLKGAFLTLFETPEVLTSETDAAGEFLTLAAYWGRKGGSYLTFQEARNALQKAPAKVRQSALSMLARIVGQQKAWRSFGKSFLTGAWPKEARYRSSETTNLLINVAEADHKNFPEIVATILPYLTAVDHPDMFIFRGARAGRDGSEDTLVARWPIAVLNIANAIVPENIRSGPYKLAEFWKRLLPPIPAPATLERGKD